MEVVNHHIPEYRPVAVAALAVVGNILEGEYT